MARPYKHPRTGVYYFRQRVPTDLRRLLGDKIVSRSLHTKDKEQAKVRNAVEVQKQAMVWERHRKQPEPLPHAQIVALSGILYREVMAALALEPGEATVWQAVLNLLDRVASTPAGLARWYGPDADRLLLEEGLVTDDASRARLLTELDRALRQAVDQQLKQADGDYSPDPKANRFPALSVASKAVPEAVTIRALVGPGKDKVDTTGKGRQGQLSVLPIMAALVEGSKAISTPLEPGHVVRLLFAFDLDRKGRGGRRARLKGMAEETWNSRPIVSDT
jgi:hypothetical protein